MDKPETLAKILWDYHVLNQKIEKSDCILSLGNKDIRTAHKAAELFINDLGGYVVVTGGFGRLTKDAFNKSEAQVFFDELTKLGVPGDKILLEDRATNTFDNIRFTKQLLQSLGLEPKSFIVVTKPYMERRAYATFCGVWPEVSAVVSSPNLSFDDYPNQTIPAELLINMILGDHQRLMLFSESGSVPRQELPATVTEAYETLVDLGYDKQLVPTENIPQLLAAVAAGAKNSQ